MPLLRHRRGFLIPDVRRQPAPTLRVGQLLTLGGEAPLCREQRVAHRREPDFGIHKGGVQRLLLFAGVGRRRPLGEKLIEAGAQGVKHRQDFRIVLA